MDLYIDPSTNDFVIEDGLLKTVDDSDAKAQRIRARLLTVMGEWFLGPNFGTDYHGIVWVKQTPAPLLAAHLQQQILLSADTGDIVSAFDMVFDSVNRTMKISASVQAPDGTTTSVTV